ncbi:conserved hypothetical protein [Ricinus communis]|uniref:Uncharacterized protein n=1 Tax=Ricinus communis TaxID=3988 RepID=B9SGG6_RICCO|nr:conserved hypothetical protein [Ricinus communis]
MDNAEKNVDGVRRRLEEHMLCWYNGEDKRSNGVEKAFMKGKCGGGGGGAAISKGNLRGG